MGVIKRQLNTILYTTHLEIGTVSYIHVTGFIQDHHSPYIPVVIAV